MNAFALAVLRTSFTSSLVMLPLLLLAKPISRRYQPKSCYWMWLILALRLLLPFDLSLFQPAMVIELPYGPLADRYVMPGGGEEISAISQVTEKMAPVQIWETIWLLGILLVCIIQLSLYLRTRRHLMNTSCLNEALSAVIPVRCGAVSTPMTMGYVCPVIFLPDGMDPVDGELALSHELCHIRRKDLWYKAFFLAVCFVYWFNPLAWWMSRIAGENLELCCDQDMVEGRTLDFRHTYGQLLLRCASSDSASVWMMQLGGMGLKGRIMSLFVTKKRGTILVCAVTCTILLLGSAVGYRSQAVQLETDKISESIQHEVQHSDQVIWPLENNYILSRVFGVRVHPITGQRTEHSGVDIAAEEGTPILTATDGVVEQTGFDPEQGNYILLTHSGGLRTLYGHLSEAAVKKGDSLLSGQVLGKVGRTGMATGSFLHFEVWHNGELSDPLKLYPDTTFTLKN